MRRILKYIFTLFILFGCNETNLNKPNIVWFVFEDQSPDFFPQYADVPVKLPAIQSIADDGVVFMNMHSPSPVCAPSRSAIITGMYPTTLGTHNMRTYNAYKTENEPSINIPSYSPNFPKYIRPFTEYLRKSGFYCTNNSKEDYNFKISDSAWDESSNNAHWKNRNNRQPFFSVFNFGICHESGIWRMNNDSILVDKSKIKIPPYFPENDIIRHDMAVNFSNLVRADRQVLDLINELKSSGEYDNTYIFFYADHGGPFPRHKRAIYETGTKVPLIIKPPKGVEIDNNPLDLLSFIDLAPTVLSIAGIDIPDYIQGTAFLGDQKRESPKLLFSGSDRFDEQVDRLRAVFDGQYKYIKNYDSSKPHAIPVNYRLQMPMMQELLKLLKEDKLNEKQKFWFNIPKPSEEFYDLKNDPYELNNLINDPNYADIVQSFSNKLELWIKDTNDLGEVPESEIINRSIKNDN